MSQRSAQLACLEEALAAMPPATREVFLAHRIEGPPYEEIAARSGLTTAEVERHIASAIIHIDLALSAADPAP